MRKVFVAVGLAAGLASAQAAVLVNFGGSAQWLGPAYGTAFGAVQWDVPMSVTCIALTLPATTDGWVADAVGNTIVSPLAPILGGVFWGAVVGIPPLTLGTDYYLVFGGGGGVGGPVWGPGGMTVTGATENFQLVPEPGTYGLVAGLGLAGFAVCRRLRG